MSDPILFPCATCGSGAGEQCMTKGGSAKVMCRGRGQKGAPFAASTPEPTPKFRDPGPAFMIADVPGMPAEAATYFAMRNAKTLADLRPGIEAAAQADAQSEPVFTLVGGTGFEIPARDGIRYRAADALLALLGGRVHMLKVMAGWSIPVPPAPPPPVEDFDENTPPPKRRPPGELIPRRVILPPGEDIVGIFAQWDREGRVPSDRGRVALVHKARPAWQRGRLNGIGGKVEAGETPRQAMAREFREETGYFTFESDWSLKVIHRGPGHVVYFFRADRPQTVDLRYDGDEPCEWVDRQCLHNWPLIPNLHWLIPLCLDDDLRFPIEVYDHSDPNVDGATARSRGDSGSAIIELHRMADDGCPHMAEVA